MSDSDEKAELDGLARSIDALFSGGNPEPAEDLPAVAGVDPRFKGSSQQYRV